MTTILSTLAMTAVGIVSLVVSDAGRGVGLANYGFGGIVVEEAL